MGRCYWNNQNDTRMYVYLNISIVKVQETDEGGGKRQIGSSLHSP